MLCLPRRVVYSPSLKHLVKSFRAVSSNVTSLISSDPVHNNAATKDEKKCIGYGEKEICLLPSDTRTPLPGNTGLAPLSMLFLGIKYPLPASAGDNCDVTTTELPEERHESTFSQCTLTSNEPAIIPYDQILECAAHECPQLLRKDFLDLFPKIDLFLEDLTVITLCQKTENDMSIWSEIIDLERGKLEECFIGAAEGICFALKDSGYWADFIHPSKGSPYFNPVSNATMLETDLRYRNFGFTVEDLGCCKVISHHRWGTNAFVGAIFTNAPLESPEITDILEKHSKMSSIFV